MPIRNGRGSAAGAEDGRVREVEWEREFHEFERNGKLPGLSIVYFPNDHTVGTSPGAPTPEAYMADNDLAIGRMVDAVSHSRYDTAAALATIEDLLGMPPMSIFDQRATRMWASFAGRPDLRPYRAIQPQVVPFGQPGSPTNKADAPLGPESARQDFSGPDRADEHTLNTATWKSVRGARSRMPAPRHSLVMPPGSAGEDEGEEPAGGD